MSIPDEAMRAVYRQQKIERVTKEGFETTGYDPDDGVVCQYKTWRKPKRTWLYEPCGKPATIVIQFAGPDHPAGMDVPLCRECLGKLTKEMIGWLSYDDPDPTGGDRE